jgi:glucuronoarabinoxylan endo-1,4-beta-xylanase
MASSVSITWTNICQPIDGFGASSAFTGGSITAAQADLFFSQSLGIGLSFVRTLIPIDGTVGPTGTLQAAVSRGANVWATPWSPPTAWKTNKKTTNAGSLLPGDYQKYADYLCSYVTTLKSQTGIDLYALFDSK